MKLRSVACLAVTAGALIGSCQSGYEQNPVASPAEPVPVTRSVNEPAQVTPTSLAEAPGSPGDLPTPDAEIVEQAELALGWASGTNESRLESLENTRAILQQQEEQIALCMREQGFDYFPVPTDEQVTIYVDVDLEYGSPEWTARYGFGITTMRSRQSRLAPGLIGYPDESDLNVRDLDEDRNAQYLLGLNEDAVRRYFLALYGSDPRETALEGPASGLEGCYGRAQEMFPLPSVALTEKFGEDLIGIEARIDADPALVRREAEIIECVARQGLEFPGYDGLQELLEGKLVEERVYAPSPFGSESGSVAFGGAGLSEGYAVDAEGNRTEIIIEDQPFLEYSPGWMEGLRVVQQFEIQLAQAAQSCGGGPAEWLAFRNSIAAEYRNEFLATNWTDIVQVIPVPAAGN